MSKDGHHIGSSIEYLTHDEHVKKHHSEPHRSLKRCRGCPYELANGECALSEFPEVGCAREGVKE